MTVSQLEAEMSVEEFIEWSIFLRLQHEEYETQRKEAMNAKTNHKSRL